MTTLPGASRRGSHRAAVVVTEVSSPIVVLALLSVAMGVATTPMPAGLLWGLAAAGFVAGGPSAVLYGGVALGHFGDRHLVDRTQRRVPLLAAVGIIAAGAVTLPLVGAPRPVVALVGAILVGLVLGTALTAAWKVSFHTGVMALATTTLTIGAGPSWLLTLPLIALVGWSRLRLCHHTPGQVLVGVVVGALPAGVVFAVLTGGAAG